MTAGQDPNQTLVNLPPRDDVLTTVFNFDQFKIRKYIHGKITILEATGNYSPLLGKELERLAAQARAYLALDLAGITGLQSAILTTLKNIQKRLRSRKKHFLICNPSERLLDILTLNELTNQFQIVTSDDLQSTGLSALDRCGPKAESPPASGDEPVAKLTTAPLRREITHLTQSLKRTEILEKGLDSASRCVQRFLPSRSPTCEGWDFAFSHTPCDKVGGDFFDFVRLDEHTLGLTIGDVSGHGLDSAIIMGMAKKVIRMRARDLRDCSPGDVLKRANCDLFEDLGRHIFITVLFARLDLLGGTVQFARAGHEPPLVFRPGAGLPPATAPTQGLALGMDRGPRFDLVLREASLSVSPGEGLLLYTDGIVESWNPRNDTFSRDRLLYTIEHLPALRSAEDVLAQINSAVEVFSEGRPPEDDMTAIVIMRN